MPFKKIIIVVFCCLLVGQGAANAHQAVIDSLENRLTHDRDAAQLDIHIALAKEYWDMSPQQGLEYANRAAELARSLGDKHKESKALLYGGVNAWFISSFDLAIDYYQQSLTLAESINDKRLIAYNLNNLGMVSSHLQNYQKAINYYTRSSIIMKELGDDIEYAKIVNNIGKLNALLGDYNTALQQQLSIVDVAEKSNERTFYLWLLCDIGALYRNLDNDKLAKTYFTKALQQSREIDDKVGKSIISRNLGCIAMHDKNYTAAKRFFDDGLELAVQANAKEEIREHYKNLSEYYATMGLDKKALEHYQLYKVYSDSVLNESKMNAIVEMETKYETERKDKENVLLRQDNEIRALEIEKQRYLRNFFIVLLVVSIVITGVVYNQFRTKKNMTNVLSEQNQLLEKTLFEKTEALEANKLLLREMNHRVKNNLMVVQSLLNIQSHRVGDTESKTVLKESASRVSAVSRLHSMLSGSVNLKKVLAKDYVYGFIRDLADNFAIDQSRIEIDLNLEDIQLDIDILVPFALVLNELVTNAFKYAFDEQEQGTLLISLTNQADNMVKLVVKDNGKGFPQDYRIEDSESMGMEIVRSLVRQIQGTMEYHSVPNQGFEFKMSFPKKVD